MKYDPTQISLEQIAAEISLIGYKAEVVSGDDDKAEIDLLVSSMTGGYLDWVSMF